jgi:putative tryptophan/tyrosine transport system substrate-binding protein
MSSAKPSLRRREAFTLFASIAINFPLILRAEESVRIRRVGVLMNLMADHPDAAPRSAALQQALQELGWTDGRNVRIEYRWGDADVALYRRYARELVALDPDVIVAAPSGWIATELQRATNTVPIVLAGTIDPVASGYVDSFARPASNITGFSRIEYSFSAKWLELLMQIAPDVKRVAILRDPKWNGDRQFSVIETAAKSLAKGKALKIDLSEVRMIDANQIERAVTEFANKPGGGMVLTASTLSTIHSQLIITLAARHRLPAVYPNASHVARGGLISYGPSATNEYRRAAVYVDRILRGAKPADLPLQAPTAFETVLNLKTARDLGLNVPDDVQIRVDQIIE